MTPEIKFLIILVSIPIVMFLLVGFVLFYMKFSRELYYLNSEISRTVGSEKREWIKKRRRLWLSILPFFKY